MMFRRHACRLCLGPFVSTTEGWNKNPCVLCAAPGGTCINFSDMILHTLPSLFSYNSASCASGVRKTFTALVSAPWLLKAATEDTTRASLMRHSKVLRP